VAGDYVCVSTTNDGQGHDAGLSPACSIPKGRVIALVSGSTYSVSLIPGDLSPSFGTGSFVSFAPTTNQTVQGTSASIVGLIVKPPAGIPNSTDIFRVTDPSNNPILAVTKDGSGNLLTQFGAGTGGNITAAYFGSGSTPLSASGVLRLGNTDVGVGW